VKEPPRRSNAVDPRDRRFLSEKDPKHSALRDAPSGKTQGDLQMKISLRLIASTALALIMGSTCFGRHYSRIKDMWALSSQNVSPNNVDYPAGLTARVYFTAGPSHGAGGLFGYLPVASTEEHVGQASPQSLRSTSKMHAHIRSTPAGADILVDNGYVGTTPLDIDLICCWHDVTLIKAGRKPWTRRVRIAAGEDLKITAHLRE